MNGRKTTVSETSRSEWGKKGAGLFKDPGLESRGTKPLLPKYSKRRGLREERPLRNRKGKCWAGEEKKKKRKNLGWGEKT